MSSDSTPLVVELQREALDRECRVSDLLRKALVVARKLQLDELHAWAQRELDGYGEGAPQPEYRQLVGTLECRDPYRGWVPIVIEDPKTAEAFSKRFVGAPIGQIEHLFANAESEKSRLSIPIPKSIEVSLIRGADLPGPPAFHVSRNQVFGILEGARNVVLNWALKLEEDGVLGEGMQFTREERETVSTHNYQIGTFIGQVSGSQVQTHARDSSQVLVRLQLDLAAVRSLTDEINRAVETLEVTREERQRLQADLNTLRNQLESPAPNNSILREALRSIRAVLESAAGSIAAAPLIQQIVNLLGEATTR